METPQEQQRSVIERIRNIRNQKGITQMALSFRANLSQSFIASLETGKKEPSLLTIIKIANALEVSPTVFFSETAENYRPTGSQQENRRNKRIKDKIIDLLEML